MVYVFVTGCVQQAKCYQQEFPGGVGNVQQLLTQHRQVISNLLCFRWSESGGPDGRGSQKEKDGSLRPVLRLEVTNAHGRITAPPSSPICGHRAVRHITLTSA